MDDLITKEELIRDLIKIGVTKGDLLHLKVSLRSIGKMEDGANTLLDALLEVVGPEGTLVIDSFITMYPLPLSKEHRKIISRYDTPSYAGALANAMIKYPTMYRSNHPIHRFAAIGSKAKDLMLRHTPESHPYQPLVDMINLHGKNLTIGDKVVGVGTTHVSILAMGFKQKIPYYGVNYQNDNGEVRLFKCNWIRGFCAAGYWNLVKLYEKGGGIIKKSKIGNAMSMLTDMKKTYDIEIAAMRTNPRVFLCDRPYCWQCRITWDISEKKYLKTIYYRILNALKNRSVVDIVRSQLRKNNINT